MDVQTIVAAAIFAGALKSDMDESITENKLKTTGIYAWVRNPMYGSEYEAYKRRVNRCIPWKRIS